MSEPAAGSRVSTLELFFDLVFVFTITQLTSVLHADPTAGGLLRVVLMLGVIWWMYAGYVWLTNAVAPDSTSRRLLLLGGMSAFLVLALAIPRAFTDDGIAFGLAYLAVIAVHTFMFLRSTGSGRHVILRFAPLNVAAALLIVTAGIVGGQARYALWILALGLEAGPQRFIGPHGFTIAPGHFVERHSQVVLIAIGESVVAIGAGAAGTPIDPALASVAVLGLLLSAGLWWAYFGGDDGRAEKALEEAKDGRGRPRLALDAFGYAYFLLLLGVVATAAALRDLVRHAGATLSEPHALALGGGVAVFLLGDAYFRHVLAIGPRRWRLAAALLALTTAALGVAIAAVVQLTALIAVLLAVFALEHAGARRASSARGAATKPAV